jgi:hypothetical protein
VALGQLFVRNGETLKDAIRRDNDEAPFGRCGDQEKSGDFPGCGTPLITTGMSATIFPTAADHDPTTRKMVETLLPFWEVGSFPFPNKNTLLEQSAYA